MELSYYLYYAKNWSFFLNLLILFSPVLVVLFQDGSQ